MPIIQYAMTEVKGSRLYLAYNEVNGMLVVARPFSARNSGRTSNSAHMQVHSAEGHFVIEAEYPLPRPLNVPGWVKHAPHGWPDVVVITCMGMHAFQRPPPMRKAQRAALRGRHTAFESFM